MKTLIEEEFYNHCPYIDDDDPPCKNNHEIAESCEYGYLNKKEDCPYYGSNKDNEF